MWMLSLDSSTAWCSVAIGDGRQWHVRDEHVGQAHSERFLPMVRMVLAEAGLALRQLDGIAFGAGPGSFTGIRIACGVAQGLALGADLPVVAVPTLEAIAEDARRVHGWTSVAACLDARMREVYFAVYRSERGAWRTLMDPMVASPGTLRLPTLREAVSGAGNGYAAYPELSVEQRLAAVDPNLNPTARSIGELALPRLAAGGGVDAALAQPCYVRHRVALTTAERDAGARM
jgi:tRNA threonylcarbamoyladenosine biosynthesis protein TsaB